MSTDNDSNINDNESKKDVLEVMKDLQPVAFLFSVCLVVAAFYVNPQNGVAKINLTDILMSSLFFFLAYLELFFFKKSNFIWFFWLGEVSLVAGAIFIFKSFQGIAEIIDQASIATNGLYVAFSLFSFCLTIIVYLLEKTKSGIIHDFCKLFFYLSLFLFCLYIVLYLFVLQTEFQILVLTKIINQIYSLLWITLKVCLSPLVFTYIWEYPTLLRTDNLFTKLKKV